MSNTKVVKKNVYKLYKKSKEITSLYADMYKVLEEMGEEKVLQKMSPALLQAKLFKEQFSKILDSLK